MFKKLAQSYHRSNWKKSLAAISNRPSIIFWTILLDAGFLALFLLLNYVLNLLIPADLVLDSTGAKQVALLLGLFGIFIIYAVLILIAYSFFSLIILGKIKALSRDHDHDFGLLKNMFLINLLLFIVFFLVFVLFNGLSRALSSASDWVLVLAFIIFILLLVLIYAFSSFMHSTFIMGHGFFANLKKSLRYTFSGAYFGLIITNLLIIGCYIGLVILFSVLFKDTVIARYESFITIANIITLIIVYALFAFNRIYFYFIAEKHIGHKTAVVTVVNKTVSGKKKKK